MGKKNKSKNVFSGKVKLDSVAGTNDDEIIDEERVDKVDFELDQRIQEIEKEKVDEGNEEENDMDEQEDELDAEVMAVMTMRAEKDKQSNSASANKDSINYNREGLQKCIESQPTRNLPFLETMIVDNFDLPTVNELEDIEREMAFYNHALMAVEKGRKQLIDMNVQVIRPNDYFCEQVKSDAHMARIKERLIIEDKKMEAFEKRKLREQQKKYNKQMAAKKKDDNAAKKKTETKNVDQYRDNNIEDNERSNNNKSNSNGANNSTKTFSNRDKKSFGDRDRPDKSTKRQAMDRKYGFGGKDRKAAKKTDKKSLNDMSEFSHRGGSLNRRPTSRPGAKGGKKPTKAHRPGKDARMKSRSK